MPTKTELATRVLRRMGALDADESPQQQDAQAVEAVMDSVYSSLKERRLIEWTLTEIPTRFQDAFINVVADRSAPDFGLSTPETQGRAQMGLREIYALTQKKDDPRKNPPRDF